MNLYDLIKRNDRSIDILSGTIEIEHKKFAGQHFRCVTMSSGSSFILRDAQGIEVVRDRLSRPRWGIAGATKGALGRLQVTVRGRDLAAVDLLQTVGDLKDGFFHVELALELSDYLGDRYDLEFEAPHNATSIVIGPLVSARDTVLETLDGRGVELGPGLSPAVQPSRNIEVTYIEQTDPADWAVLYNAKVEKPSIPDALRALYRIDDATSPKNIPSRSLDFVFSNHVCEHFPNFGQVLKNWSATLNLGGVFCGVVPDCRYSFDYRQRPTGLEEVVEWERAGGFEIPDIAYDRWCKNTEPMHTAEALKKRGYSIHVNYFTPASLAAILQHYCATGYFKGFQIWCHPNGRDIGFSIAA